MISSKKRVAIYARVSKRSKLSRHSLNAQKAYLKKYVERHKDWELINIYSDYGKSGTNTLRSEYQKLLGKCRNDNIDIVLTKSVSRIMRNKLEMTRILNEFTNLGIEIIFESENMSSMNQQDRYRLNLLATQAEMVAREDSLKQKWRIRHKFEQGQTTVGRMLGYRLKNGVLTIVPSEAEIVRIIFQLYLNGYGRSKIARKLNILGLKPSYSDKWHDSAIAKILSNEKYSGDMLLQKTYREDYGTKKNKINRGERPQYYVKGSHEAIIDKEMFNAVQKEIERRRGLLLRNNHFPKKERLFNGLIKCGVCGSVFRFRRRKPTETKLFYVWICETFEFLGKSSCNAKQIRDDILIDKTKQVLNMNESEELTREVVLDEIISIIAKPNNKLVYHLKGGSVRTITWQNKSRRNSWTPEMREKAREKALKWHRLHKKDVGL